MKLRRFFYMGVEKQDSGYYNRTGSSNYPVRDDEKVLKLFARHKSLPAEELAEKIMSDKSLWGRDLTKIEGFKQTVFTSGHTHYGSDIRWEEEAIKLSDRSKEKIKVIKKNIS